MLQALEQITLFDYATLDTETRISLKLRADRINERTRRIGQDIWENGREFYEAQQELAKDGHGCFLAWAETETGYGKSTVYNMINVYQKFVFPNFGKTKIAISAMYLLAAPSTPESARIEAQDRADQGEVITPQIARDIVSDHKNPPVPFIPTVENDEDFYGDEGPAVWEPQHKNEQPEPMKPQPALASHQLLNQSNNNEHYTPPEYIEAARELMGGIDTDPASNDIANQWIKAPTYYTITTNGLDKPWHGRVWMNPPYGKDGNDSNQDRWTENLIRQYEEGIITEAVCLVNAVPGNLWFGKLWDFPICFPSRRIKFLNEKGEKGAPTHSNALIYLPNKDHTTDSITRFVRAFSQFGPVALRAIPSDDGIYVYGMRVA
jgi:hypothetical protein